MDWGKLVVFAQDMCKEKNASTFINFISVWRDRNFELSRFWWVSSKKKKKVIPGKLESTRVPWIPSQFIPAVMSFFINHESTHWPLLVFFYYQSWPSHIETTVTKKQNPSVSNWSKPTNQPGNALSDLFIDAKLNTVHFIFVSYTFYIIRASMCHRNLRENVKMLKMWKRKAWGAEELERVQYTHHPKCTKVLGGA